VCEAHERSSREIDFQGQTQYGSTRALCTFLVVYRTKTALSEAVARRVSHYSASIVFVKHGNAPERAHPHFHEAKGLEYETKENHSHEAVEEAKCDPVGHDGPWWPADRESSADSKIPQSNLQLKEIEVAELAQQKWDKEMRTRLR
jgi:hypothetical protein